MTSDTESSVISSGESKKRVKREVEHASTTYTTPSQRARKEVRLSHTRTRVDTITKELGLPRRCLIENTGPNSHIDYVRCLDRRSRKERFVTKLEFHWGMDKGTLNLDTRYNILSLSPTFHRCFDDGDFLLLPDKRFLEGYLHKSREEFPVTDDKLYDYKLIAFETMDTVPLLRQKSSESNLPTIPSDPDFDPDLLPPLSNDEEDDYINDFTLFRYPYRNLPLLRSHLYPCYAIVKGGQNLLGVDLKQLELIRHQFCTVLASVEHPQLSTLKWILSSLREQPLLLLADSSKLTKFIQNQAAMLAEHRSNLTNAQVSELIRGQTTIFLTAGITIGELGTLRVQLKELQKRLTILEHNYPEHAEHLALSVAVYFQWSTDPPPGHPFRLENPPESRPDDSSYVTGPRSHTSMNVWLDDDAMKKFKSCMKRITWKKKMSSIADWVKALPVFDVEELGNAGLSDVRNVSH